MTTHNIEPSLESEKPDKPQQRPWAVIIYVSLLVVAALYLGLQIIFMTFFYIGNVISNFMDLSLLGVVGFAIMLGIYWGITALLAAIAWGLWQRKNWARLVAIVVQSLAMLYWVGQLFFYVVQYGIDLIPILMLIGLGILGYITRWLVKNKPYFVK